jgi:NAD(P)H-hydrate epimerase
MKREQVRQVDQIAMEQYGMSGLVLMENAGRGAAEGIAAFLKRERGGDRLTVCILCGTGNNGGDGYVIARHLAILGYPIRIVSVVETEKLSGDAQVNARIARKSGFSIAVATTVEDLEREIQDGQVMVDCLLGTGATGDPRGIYADAVRLANARQALRVAIDLPTGLDCDSGQPGNPTFQADLTITFVAEKAGFANDAAKPFIGKVQVVGIGVPPVLLEQFRG